MYNCILQIRLNQYICKLLHYIKWFLGCQCVLGLQLQVPTKQRNKTNTSKYFDHFDHFAYYLALKWPLAPFQVVTESCLKVSVGFSTWVKRFATLYAYRAKRFKFEKLPKKSTKPQRGQLTPFLLQVWCWLKIVASIDASSRINLLQHIKWSPYCFYHGLKKKKKVLHIKNTVYLSKMFATLQSQHSSISATITLFSQHQTWIKNRVYQNR